MHKAKRNQKGTAAHMGFVLLWGSLNSPNFDSQVRRSLVLSHSGGRSSSKRLQGLKTLFYCHVCSGSCCHKPAPFLRVIPGASTEPFSGHSVPPRVSPHLNFFSYLLGYMNPANNDNYEPVGSLPSTHGPASFMYSGSSRTLP